MKHFLIALSILITCLGCDNSETTIQNPVAPEAPVSDVTLRGTVARGLGGCEIVCRDQTLDPSDVIPAGGIQWEAFLSGVSVAGQSGDPGAQVTLDVSSRGSGAYTVRQTAFSSSGALLGSRDHPIEISCL